MGRQQRPQQSQQPAEEQSKFGRAIDAIDRVQQAYWGKAPDVNVFNSISTVNAPPRANKRRGKV